MTDEVDKEGVEELREAVIAFNVAVTGYTDGASLGCFVRDADGQLVAGLHGFTWGGYAMIEWLWVHDDHRHTGLGTRLMEAAENESARRGCVVVRVNTHTFQHLGSMRDLVTRALVSPRTRPLATVRCFSRSASSASRSSQEVCAPGEGHKEHPVGGCPQTTGITPSTRVRDRRISAASPCRPRCQ